ncbi:MAG: serine protease [Deltaproteobacteria bacterium]|jgi:hypothetical protein|nr:serine protease [Deltaproteobacteria bacterium]
MQLYKKLSLFLGILALIILTSPAFPQGVELGLGQPRDLQSQDSETIEKSIFFVLVETKTGSASGSGFLVANGYIMTNGHVVDDLPPRAKIYILNKYMRPTQAEIVNVQYDENAYLPGSRDLALLRFTEPEGASLTPMTFNLDADKLDWVSAWGYPGLVTDIDLNYKNIFRGRMQNVIPLPVASTTGNINAYIHGQFGDLIVHSAQISSGNSGGPLLNYRGEIIGINTWAFNVRTKRARTNLAQPATEIVAFLYSNGVNPKLKEGQILPYSKTEPALNFQEKFDALPRKDKNIGKDYFPKKPESGKSTKVLLDGISFEAPPNWTIESKDNSTAILSSQDSAASILFLTEENGIYSTEEIAEIYSKAVEGSTPTPQGQNIEAYVFHFTEDGEEAIAVVTDLKNGKHLFFSAFGDFTNTDIQKILDTLKILS